jgi:hypothetical protein
MKQHRYHVSFSVFLVDYQTAAPLTSYAPPAVNLYTLSSMNQNLCHRSFIRSCELYTCCSCSSFPELLISLETVLYVLSSVLVSVETKKTQPEFSFGRTTKVSPSTTSPSFLYIYIL